MTKIKFWFWTTAIFFSIITYLDLAETRVLRFVWWDNFHAVVSPFLVGGLISFLFYYLVVSIPEGKRRKVIKDNLKKQYKIIKKDILLQIIFASHEGGRTDLETDEETLEKLLTTEGFKKAFSGGSEGDEGFYAFENYIGQDVLEYREIIFNLKILAKQIDFALHNYAVSDANVFAFFKRLETFLLRLEAIGPGYDQEKPLSSLIWEIFAGWSLIEGYRGYDIIEKMIEDL